MAKQPNQIIVNVSFDTGYPAYLQRLNASQKECIADLRQQLSQASDNKWSWRVAAIGLGIACVLMWFNWPAPVCVI
ncbi:hypothetical protein ACH50O_11785 [Methylomonas sp. 2BW1-5-20]|uniref:hypothetical protein n=1 Tax=Methylomonas sp. 2BW1-5-20 TaxID=3376686 RepID=UPI00404FC2C4